jgi:hypothetical protein
LEVMHTPHRRLGNLEGLAILFLLRKMVDNSNILAQIFNWLQNKSLGENIFPEICIGNL